MAGAGADCSGQTIAVHAGKRVVRRLGDRIERELGLTGVGMG